MYFSRITLWQNAGKNQAFWRLGSEYSIHQAVWDLFGDHVGRERDFLYRLDNIGRFPLIYTVSVRKPVDNSSLWNLDIKDYNPKIIVGMRLGFLLKVNPTIKRDGKRHDVVMDKKKKMSSNQEKISNNEIAQIAGEQWLNTRSEKNGFKVEQVSVDGYYQLRLIKKKDNAEIRYSAIDFKGILSVTDVDIFQKLLFDGIGAEKGFGCGLMLVRKI